MYVSKLEREGDRFCFLERFSTLLLLVSSLVSSGLGQLVVLTEYTLRTQWDVQGLINIGTYKAIATLHGIVCVYAQHTP